MYPGICATYMPKRSIHTSRYIYYFSQQLNVTHCISSKNEVNFIAAMQHNAMLK